MKNNYKKAILFDLDGTLLDSKYTISKYMIQTLDILDISFRGNIETISNNLNKPFKEILELMEVNLDEINFDQYISKYREIYYENPINGSTLFPYVKETLIKLKNDNYLIILATGKHIKVAIKTMNEFKMAKIFDLIQGWEENLAPKPSTDILIKACDKLNISPKTCVMVGDTDQDILAGKALNIPTIGTTFGFCMDKVKEFNPDYLLDKFSDLPKIMEEIK